jgi:nucleoside-diphosphate-sugar epimerase
VRILLTGHWGYIGSVLGTKLSEHGHSTFGIDAQWFNGEPNRFASDVRKIASVKDIDCIIHLAAIANDPSVAYYPRLSWETSALATQQLCQMALRDGCKRFIYASSVSVYGADRGLVTEDMDLHPLSDYNKTKMVTERVLLSYADKITVQIIRPATVCGLSPRMRLDLTVNMLTMQALTKHKMTVHGGEQMRPSIHIDDMADLYLFMLAHPEFAGIYNAGFENLSLMQIAQKVRAITGAGIEVTEQRDVRSYQVNSDKLLATGFKPKKTIDDAIGELVAAYAAGELKDEKRFYNLDRMLQLAIKDE